MPALPWRLSPLALGWLLASTGCGDGSNEAPAKQPAAAEGKAEDKTATPAEPVPTSTDSDEPDYPAALAAALEDGVEPPPTGGTTRRVDPFVVAWITAAVKANGDRWLTRYEQTNADGVASKGWQVRVPEGSPLAVLGLEDGDVVERVNDVAASDVGKVAEALSLAQNQISLTVARDNFEVTLSYVLEPGLAWQRSRARLAGTDVVPGRELPDIVADADAVEDDPLPPRAGGLLPPSGASGRPPKPVPSSGSKPKPAPKPSTGGSSKGSSGSGADKVTCSGSTCTVQRAYFKSMVGSPSKLQSQASIVPAIRNDVHSGYKLKTVKSGSAVHKMGFRSGDKVTHVNGYDLTSDLEALALYSELGSTSRFNVRYVRGGSVRSKTIVVK